jgi:hypothetical protein
MRRPARSWIAALVAAAFWCCGLTVVQAADLDGQLRAARLLREQSAESRVWYLGFAMANDSPAFWGDVQALEAMALRLDPRALRIKLNNGPGGQDRWARASAQNIEKVLREVSRAASTEDLVIVAFSSHGLPGLLSIRGAGGPDGGLRSDQMRRYLAPLARHPVALVVAACYSGSWIEVLRGPKRIILTSSRRDQTSDGCGPTNATTEFVRLFTAEFSPNQSLRHTLHRVTTRMDLSKQEPLIWVADNMRPLAREPIAQWWRLIP